jgi:hypothetical protein
MYDNPHNIAEVYTMIDNYWIHPKDGQFLACIDDEVLVSIGAFDTAAAAMDACEADYIARCSEFVRVAGPGECVVKTGLLENIVADLRDRCSLSDEFCANRCSGKYCHVKDLTAAIDAASKEGGE